MGQDSKTFREQIRILERKLGLLKKNTETLGKGNAITLTQCHTLVEIGRASTISLKDLAGLLGIDISTTSRTVDTLVKKEYVKRLSSIEDRRSVDISLTDEGISIFKEIENDNNLYFKKVFSNIDPSKQAQIIESLDIILDAIDKA